MWIVRVAPRLLTPLRVWPLLVLAVVLACGARHREGGKFPGQEEATTSGQEGKVAGQPAREMADFPDVNLAESLQRVPGVPIRSTRDEVVAEEYGEHALQDRDGYDDPVAPAPVRAKHEVSESHVAATSDDASRPVTHRGGLVVYTGYLKLRVRRPLETLDQITETTEGLGGYVESLTQRAVVVRVPAKDFEAVIGQFAALGDILDRRISAVDVSEKYADFQTRLQVARQARERLLSLLERVKDVAERLRTLEEIKRLSESIENYESTLETMRNLLDFFTITIELEPLLDDTRLSTYHSPFEWVANLSAYEMTLRGGAGHFIMQLPPSFVLFDEADDYFAQAADSTLIRGAKIENEPLGDPTFWSNAVHYEMLARGEKQTAAGSSGPVSYRIYQNDDLRPHYFLVGVVVRGDELYVLEAFFPNNESLERHQAALVQAMGSFKFE